jgi:hypothetical protein
MQIIYGDKGKRLFSRPERGGIIFKRISSYEYAY